MKKWRCTVCGYIYVGPEPPAECPVCGAGPEFFEEVTIGTDMEENVAGPVNLDTPKMIQEALFKIPSGLFMVGSVKDHCYNGMINNTVFQITDHPLQLLLGMDKRHLTAEYIKESGVFSVNFLRPDQMEFVKRFGFHSGREINKFEGTPWQTGVLGTPILKSIPGFLECKVQDQSLDAGTHTVFLAEVVIAKIIQDQPVLSYQEYRARKKELWG